MNEFLTITNKVREMCIKRYGFIENEDGFLEKTLRTETEFQVLPIVFMYGLFRGAFDDTIKEYHNLLKDSYYTFEIGKTIKDLPFSKTEKEWLNEMNENDELYHWDHLMDWLKEEARLRIDTKAADMYYQKTYQEWEEAD